MVSLRKKLVSVSALLCLIFDSNCCSQISFVADVNNYFFLIEELLQSAITNVTKSSQSLQQLAQFEVNNLSYIFLEQRVSNFVQHTVPPQSSLKYILANFRNPSICSCFCSRLTQNPLFCKFSKNSRVVNIIYFKVFLSTIFFPKNFTMK